MEFVYTDPRLPWSIPVNIPILEMQTYKVNKLSFLKGTRKRSPQKSLLITPNLIGEITDTEKIEIC